MSDSIRYTGRDDDSDFQSESIITESITSKNDQSSDEYTNKKYKKKKKKRHRSRSNEKRDKIDFYGTVKNTSSMDNEKQSIQPPMESKHNTMEQSGTTMNHEFERSTFTSEFVSSSEKKGDILSYPFAPSSKQTIIYTQQQKEQSEQDETAVILAIANDAEKLLTKELADLAIEEEYQIERLEAQKSRRTISLGQNFNRGRTEERLDFTQPHQHVALHVH